MAALSMEDSLRLNGAAHAIAGVYGIEVVEPYPATVRSQVCGKPHAGDRKSTKKLVIDTLILRGLVPKTFRDDDAADAIAGLVWAESNFARRDSSFALTAR
jgi:Holliday junction resolvasome RuvABC endonuclease subunit